MRAAIDVLAAAPGGALAGDGRHGRGGRARAGVPREIGAYARERGIERCSRWASSRREAVDAFGAGAAHFAAVEALIADVAPRRAARRDAAGEGLALHAHGARGRALTGDVPGSGH